MNRSGFLLSAVGMTVNPMIVGAACLANAGRLRSISKDLARDFNTVVQLTSRSGLPRRLNCKGPIFSIAGC